MARDGHPWTLVTLATKVVRAARGGQVSNTSGHLALLQAHLRPQRCPEESTRCPDAWAWFAARFCSQKLELDRLMNPETSLKQNKFCSFFLESQWIETGSKGSALCPETLPGAAMAGAVEGPVPAAVIPTPLLRLPGDSGRGASLASGQRPPSFISAPGNAVRKQHLT